MDGQEARTALPVDAGENVSVELAVGGLTAIAVIASWLLPAAEPWTAASTAFIVAYILAALGAPVLFYVRALKLLAALELLLLTALVALAAGHNVATDSPVLFVATAGSSLGVLLLSRYLVLHDEGRLHREAIVKDGARIVTVLAVVLGLAVAGSLWWKQPNSAWACESRDETSGCVEAGQLELAEVTRDRRGRVLNGEALSRVSADVSNDGRLIVAAVERYEARGAEGALVESSVVLFDATTGAVQRRLFAFELDEEVHTLPIDSVRFSPDDSRVVFGRYQSQRFEIFVFDVGDGDQVDRLLTDDCAPRWTESLGLSADNSLVQCRDRVFDLDDGRLVYEFDRSNLVRPALVTPSFSTRDGTICHNVRSLTVIYTCAAEALNDESVLAELDESLEFYTFNPTGDLLAAGRRSEASPSRWRPRRSEQPSEIQVIETEGGDVVRTILTDRFEAGLFSTPHEWSEANDLLLLYTRLGAFALFDVSR